MSVKLPALLHVGLVVEDLAAASADYERFWGLETVNVVDLTFENAVYQGSPTALSARYGFIRSGASEIELIQPLSGRSPYTDFLESNGGDGIHHLAYIVDAIDPYLAQLEAATGAPADVLLDSPLSGGGRFAYVQGVAHGPVIELIELSPELLQQMQASAGAAIS